MCFKHSEIYVSIRLQNYSQRKEFRTYMDKIGTIRIGNYLDQAEYDLFQSN